MINIIFDMDGVLVDSEHAITVAAKAALNEWGIDVPYSHFVRYTGMGENVFIGSSAADFGGVYEEKMKQRTYEIYLENARDNVKVFEGAKELLLKLHKKNIPFALASAADFIKVKVNLECIGVDISLFSAIITGSDVIYKKPDPEIFLKAAEKAKFNPKDTIVVEDAVSGIAAAKAAGMKAVGITTTFEKEELLKAGADTVVSSLKEAINLILK